MGLGPVLLQEGHALLVRGREGRDATLTLRAESVRDGVALTRLTGADHDQPRVGLQVGERELVDAVGHRLADGSHGLLEDARQGADQGDEAGHATSRNGASLAGAEGLLDVVARHAAVGRAPLFLPEDRLAEHGRPLSVPQLLRRVRGLPSLGPVASGHREVADGEDDGEVTELTGEAVGAGDGAVAVLAVRGQQVRLTQSATDLGEGGEVRRLDAGHARSAAAGATADAHADDIDADTREGDSRPLGSDVADHQDHVRVLLAEGLREVDDVRGPTVGHLDEDEQMLVPHLAASAVEGGHQVEVVDADRPEGLCARVGDHAVVALHAVVVGRVGIVREAVVPVDAAHAAEVPELDGGGGIADGVHRRHDERRRADEGRPSGTLVGDDHAGIPAGLALGHAGLRRVDAARVDADLELTQRLGAEELVEIDHLFGAEGHVLAEDPRKHAGTRHPPEQAPHLAEEALVCRALGTGDHHDDDSSTGPCGTGMTLGARVGGVPASGS